MRSGKLQAEKLTEKGFQTVIVLVAPGRSKRKTIPAAYVVKQGYKTLSILSLTED